MRNHNPVEHFFALAPSHKGAIEAMCGECQGCTKNHLEEWFKKEVRNCTASCCPLHAQVVLCLKLGEVVNDKSYSGAKA
jgi:hypothetical protein